jgi:hypothetical protein
MTVWYLLAMLACDRVPDLVEDGRPAACAERVVSWADADGDGLGSATRAAIGCEAPDGYVDNADDCDDADPAPEACDDSGGLGDTGGSDTGGSAGARR